jgi:hypothetical protein
MDDHDFVPAFVEESQVVSLTILTKSDSFADIALVVKKHTIKDETLFQTTHSGIY